MTAVEETRLWHPFADMGSVRHGELVIERGEDVWVWDTDGSPLPRRDREPVVRERRTRAPGDRRGGGGADGPSSRRTPAFGDLSNPPARELASMLTDLAPMPSRVFLTSGGGESIDAAAKLAVRYWYELGQTQRTTLISRTAGYHGTNGFGTALAGIPANRHGFGPQVHTIQVPHDSLEALEGAIEEAGADHIAAVFVEPVIGAGGAPPAGAGLHRGAGFALRADRRAAGRRLGHLRLRPARHVVRNRALVGAAGHDHVREGRHQRLPPTRRGDRLRASRRAVLGDGRRTRASATARPTPRTPPAARRRSRTSRCSDATACSSEGVSSSSRCSTR